ncbi:hydrogenase subunit MbhD domain-containing protein [Vitiosangium sp. GDMCC 1.1324]|uniref:hydrogenase subunit MbhD domain-containing protein n=1 Tax=Vitiosangium sp. (strain GDMCC 1.1324) TaxID=2138576 RepID=UPI0018EE6387|nr:hydrogenase subunit MbhD domain-containing protein [Vitiosangium sp. GDMCC 1.1324]
MMKDPLVVQLMQVGILLLVATMAAGVVLTREPTSQSITVSLYGLLLALMFFLFQAPDVALSQLTVGAVALPLMILLALARIRRDREAREQRERREHEEA